MRRKLSRDQRKKRREARQEILDTANAHRDNMLSPLRMRNLQEAVSICRRRRLVDPEELEEAGFNPS